MEPPLATDLILIRHAPAETGGRLCGRSDVPARLPDAAVLARLRAALGEVAALRVSPALRCRQTAEALFPGQVLVEDARLWEQDFGAQEGMALKDLPDLGPLSRAELAAIVPPGGESFAAMVARVTPALQALEGVTGPIAVVAHAGTVRAALGMVLGDVSAGLAFEVAPLSWTRLRLFPGGGAVVQVNAQI